MSSKRGYSRVPTIDPDSFASGSSNYGAAANPSLPSPDPIFKKKKGKTTPKNLRPGLFYQFGDRGKFAANHASVALGNQSESEHEGEKIELIDIKPRRSKLKRLKPKSPKMIGYSRNKTDIVEEPILPGDTVQRVALRYGCRDSEIRRVNNLYGDQDFFALKTVKIPIREHGVLSDESAREKCRKNRVDERSADSSGGATTSDERRLGGASAYYASEDEPSSSSRDADDEVGYSDGPEYRDVSIQSALKWKHTNHKLLQKLDEDLEKAREDNEKRASNANSVRLTLETPAFQPIVTDKNSFHSNLFLFNLDWKILVGLLIFIVVVFGCAALGMVTLYSYCTDSKSDFSTHQYYMYLCFSYHK